MAINKWLSDLQTLKSTTDTLRTTLRNKSVTALDADTLPTLVSKVPSLAPIVESEDDKWQPDPLWKFPDPNGTETTKTIREIYDEDALASSYAYRGIYQIRGEDDTIDLKAVMNKRTNADTFILSDGTTYENITATTLEHTWDKDKDVIDSKGNRQRYVRVYSNTVSTYRMNFYGLVVWYVDNMHTGSFNVVSDNYAADGGLIPVYLECAEYGNKVTTAIVNILEGTPVKKIVFENIISTSISSSNLALFKNLMCLKELYIIFSNFNVSNTTYILDGTQIKSLSFDADAYTTKTFSVYGQTTSSSIRELLGTENLNVSTFALRYLYGLDAVNIPYSAKTITVSGCINIKNLIIPEKVTSLTATGLYGLKELIINSSVLTSCNISYNTGLRKITVPIDWNVAIHLSSSSLLEHDSIVNLLENLKDLTGETAKTLKLGSVNLAKLTDEEKAIATNKNWTLS